MKRFSKKKRERIHKQILDTITALLGKDKFIKKDNNKIKIYTGIRDMMEYIYTKGDCGRFALILHHAFVQYKPDIYYISWTNNNGESNWHFITKIFDKYYDAHGELSGNIQQNFKYKIKITKVNNKWLDDEKNIEKLTGNFPFHRIIMEMLQYTAFHNYYLEAEYENNEFKIKGFNHDKLTNIIHLFNKIKNEHISVEKWNEEISHLNFIKYEKESYM